MPKSSNSGNHLPIPAVTVSKDINQTLTKWLKVLLTIGPDQNQPNNHPHSVILLSNRKEQTTNTYNKDESQQHYSFNTKSPHTFTWDVKLQELEGQEARHRHARTEEEHRGQLSV